MLGRPFSPRLVEGDVGLGGLAAEDGGACGEVGVEGVEVASVVAVGAGADALRGGDPFLDLRLLGRRELLRADGGHCGLELAAEAGDAAAGGGAPEGSGEGSNGEQLGG
ncbi:hypothetical protein NLG97_g4718 [Lecanicillium saksenae]|uniref:Uncharacterized protein n=1 Tax=Lecanicillium saksenae TaxID=468837 RepID=A0ACC1QYD9_9HYPO|nr:hypothetical protein NLG97_g4718 [Lecanicillium saksenae]